MRRVLIALVVIVLLIGALTAWVVVPAASRLTRARDAIAETSTDLDPEDLQQALTDLKAARDRFESLPGKVLGFVPLVGANVGAVRSVTDALIPVVRTAAELAKASESIREDGFLRNGEIRVSTLRDLAAPLSDEVVALQGLEIAANDALTGALMPALWDDIEELAARAKDLRQGLDRAATLLRESPELLGVGKPRRYLIMLMNNAELRGAGGLLAGIGTMRFDNGKLKLEEISSVHDLDVEPRVEVPAPPTFERRFSQFQANTSLWVNATYSPDVPDVAIVASRLYQRITGLETDGALLLDPRGLAALLEEDVKLDLEGFGEVPAEDLPRVVYSDAYDTFDDLRGERRDAVLGLGIAAFESFLENGLPEDGIEAITDAVAGGHLAFVSFDRTEGRALAEVGASRDLPAAGDDVLLVTVQNLGGRKGEGSKLDYWATRSTDHACDIEPEEMTCATSVRLRNDAPKGLRTYVAGKPYGLLRSYLEIYIPGDATVEEVRLGGRAVDFRPDPHDDMLSIAVYLEIPRTEEQEVTVVYRAPVDANGYQLVGTPQPLARDGRLSIALGIPDGWSTSGQGRVEDGRLRYRDRFDSPVEIEVAPGRRTGLSSLWQGLKRFWNEPIF